MSRVAGADGTATGSSTADPPGDAEGIPRRWFGISLVVGVMGVIMVGVLLLAVLPTRAWFAQRHHGLLTDTVEAITQTHSRRRLALARRCGVDGGHQNQLAILLGFQRVDII